MLHKSERRMNTSLNKILKIYLSYFIRPLEFFLLLDKPLSLIKVSSKKFTAVY